MTVIALVTIGALFVLLAIGVPVAFSIGAAGIIGMSLSFGGLTPAVLLQLPMIALNTLNFTNSALPLYILFGELLVFSGVGHDMFQVADRILRRVPGGIGVAIISGSTLLAAVTGATTASIAAFGNVALTEAEQASAPKRMVLGALAASGTLGILIPPSISMILYTSVTGVSLGKLFEAGFLPGIMLAAMMALYVVLSAVMRRRKQPSSPSEQVEKPTVKLWAALPGVFGIVIVLGSIYTGFATPTEAAGLGGLYALVLAIIRWMQNRKNAASPQALAENKEGLKRAFIRSAEVSAMMMMLVIAAEIFGTEMTILNMPQTVTNLVLGFGLGKWGTFILIMVALYFLGMVLNPGPIILLVTPIVLPILVHFGFNPIWFGIVLIVHLEIAAISPPVGINLYVLKAVAQSRASISEIIASVVPYWGILTLAMVILSIFPQIAMWLTVVGKA